MSKRILPKVRVRPPAMRFLLWAILVFIVIDALAKFNILKISAYVSPVFIPAVAGLFILLDVGVLSLKRGIKKMKLTAVNWFLVIFAILVLIGVALTLLGIASQLFSTIQGVTNLLLGLAVLVSIFTD